MDTALAIALIGASVSIVGWAVNHILSTSAERSRERLNFQIEFTKQQLEELYGPLAFLVLEGRRTYQDLLAALGRKYVFVVEHIQRVGVAFYDKGNGTNSGNNQGFHQSEYP